MGFEVSFNVPDRKLGNSNIEFKVALDGEKLGVLYVSKGVLAWQPRNGRKTHKLDWRRFAELIEEHGAKRSGA